MVDASIVRPHIVVVEKQAFLHCIAMLTVEFSSVTARRPATYIA